MQEKSKFIYLDNNATTRTDAKVLGAMLPYFTEDYANAASSHLSGLTVNEAVENAREQVAELLNAKSREIIFTSGATEAINLAIKGLINSTKKHIITVTTEHKAVLDTCKYMEEMGFNVSYLPVQSNGIIDLDILARTITEDTLMVCVMFANNETGVLQPVTQIAELTRRMGCLFMCDATQAVGKADINVDEMDIDLLPLSAHKFYGPKGVGALYVSAQAKIRLDAQMHGGGHQRNLRSGTLNVPGIIGLGAACAVAGEAYKAAVPSIKKLRDNLENGLLSIDGTFVNGAVRERLYTTTNICFPGINSEKLIVALQHIAVSSGSACTAATTEPSYVLKAMGMSDADALVSIRFSLGKYTTQQDIDITVKRVTELVNKMRS